MHLTSGISVIAYEPFHAPSAASDAPSPRTQTNPFRICASQWVALPVVPAAWLAFGALLMLATGVTKRLLQPQLSPHRPVPMFSVDFARWWLVQRLIGTVNLLFADQLRGTPALVWWFRMLVRPDSELRHRLRATPAFNVLLGRLDAQALARCGLPHRATKKLMSHLLQSVRHLRFANGYALWGSSIRIQSTEGTTYQCKA